MSCAVTNLSNVPLRIREESYMPGSVEVWGITLKGEMRLAFAFGSKQMAVDWANYMFNGGAFVRTEVRSCRGVVVYVRTQNSEGHIGSSEVTGAESDE